MNISIGDRWKGVIAEAVGSGRFASPDDVVTEALHLLAERERRFQALKASIAEALADPREVSEAEIDAALEAVDARLRDEGIE